jgi:hypothetical protein
MAAMRTIERALRACSHLFHVTLEAPVVLQHLLRLLLTAPELFCEGVYVVLCHLLVEISEVLVQVVKILPR